MSKKKINKGGMFKLQPLRHIAENFNVNKARNFVKNHFGFFKSLKENEGKKFQSSPIFRSKTEVVDYGINFLLTFSLFEALHNSKKFTPYLDQSLDQKIPKDDNYYDHDIDPNEVDFRLFDKVRQVHDFYKNHNNKTNNIGINDKKDVGINDKKDVDISYDNLMINPDDPDFRLTQYLSSYLLREKSNYGQKMVF